MRVDRVALSVFTNFLRNAFHILNNGEQDLVNLSIPTMRNPLTAIFTNTVVTFYAGNQFQGSGGNPGNQLGSGSAMFYKKSTDSIWSSLPLVFFTNGVSNVNNKYYSVLLPANSFNAGDTVQYYFKIPYSDHGTTSCSATTRSGSRPNSSPKRKPIRFPTACARRPSNRTSSSSERR